MAPVQPGVFEALASGVTPEGEPVESFDADRMWTGGIFMSEDGAVLSSGQGGIMWNNPDTGRLYFGTVDIEMIVGRGRSEVAGMPIAPARLA